MKRSCYCGEPRKADAGFIDGLAFLSHAECAEPDARGAKGIRLQDLRPALDVLLVNLLHHGGLRQVQLVKTTVDEDALGIEHGPHCTVGHKHLAKKQIAELSRSRNRGSSTHEQTRVFKKARISMILAHTGGASTILCVTEGTWTRAGSSIVSIC